MTALVPDSYTISHFTAPEDGLTQANIFLTARVNASRSFGLVGRPRYFEDTVQEWMISKHVGGDKMLFSICNVATGQYLSRSPASSDGSGPSLVLSDARYSWRMQCVDMNYSIMSGSENAETLQVQFGAQSRNSISTDDLPIRLLSSPVTAQPQTNNFHVWTLIPTFRVMESPVVQPIQRFNPEPPSQIPTIHAPIPPLVLSEPDFSGTFYIKHPSSGFALDLYYSLRVDNTPVTLAEANDGPSQVWKIIKKPRLDSDEPDGENGKPDHYWVQCVASGTYLSYSELGSEGVPKFATGNAEPLDWLVEPVGDLDYPHFRLLAAGKNLALDVAAGQMIDGAKVILAQASISQSGQHFSFEPTRVISKRRSNSSFKVFKLLGTRARATSTVSLRTTSSSASTTGTFLGSPDTSAFFGSDLASNL